MNFDTRSCMCPILTEKLTIAEKEIISRGEHFNKAMEELKEKDERIKKLEGLIDKITDRVFNDGFCTMELYTFTTDIFNDAELPLNKLEK